MATDKEKSLRELSDELAHLKWLQWDLDNKDHWDSVDWDYANELSARIKELEEHIEMLKG